MRNFDDGRVASRSEGLSENCLPNVVAPGSYIQDLNRVEIFFAIEATKDADSLLTCQATVATASLIHRSSFIKATNNEVKDHDRIERRTINVCTACYIDKYAFVVRDCKVEAILLGRD